MTDALALDRGVPSGVRVANVFCKSMMVILLGIALVNPEFGNLEDKAAGLRAIGYPLAAFAVPLLWWRFWQDRAPYPWLADLLITLACFSDVLGNRMDLYDLVVWFDDWMHLMNTGVLAAAVVLLTLPRSAGFVAVAERSLAFGATAAIAWEIAEYFAFISGGTEKEFAYEDTLGDLGLGVLGAAIAAVFVYRLSRRGVITAEPLEKPGARV